MHAPGILGLAFLAGDTYPSNPLQEYMDCIFLLLYTTPAGAVKVSSMIYTSLPGDEGTDYLFMNNLDRFRLERVSSHFSRQYEERYIDPNQIQLNGLLPAIYFMRTAGDRKIAPYTPDTWTEEEKRTNIFSCRSKGPWRRSWRGVWRPTLLS